jgi:hypothetical protein
MGWIVHPGVFPLYFLTSHWSLALGRPSLRCTFGLWTTSGHGLDRLSRRVSAIFLDLLLVARLGPAQFEVHVWALDDLWPWVGPFIPACFHYIS